MKRTIRCLLTTFLLLAAVATGGRAEDVLPAQLQQLNNETYQYYSSRQTDKFFESVDRLKMSTQFSPYQETYYRACTYEAIYMFEYVDRKKGVEMAHAIYHHAEENSSNIGMYFATFTLGSIRQLSGNNDMAEKSFQQALELRKKYQPGESAAPCYLGLCEIALRQKDYEKVQTCARKALDEPKVIPMNQITAWSYKCLVRYNQGDSLGFEEAYEERARLINKYGGQGGLFGELINVYQAKNRKQWQKALARTDNLLQLHHKCAQKADIYEHMGDMQKALYWQKRTLEVTDSLQALEARSQMTEFDAEFSIARAENEVKEQQLVNDRLLLAAAIIIGAVVIVFLLVIAYRRKKHMQRLESINRELRTANSQLEETTKAKERIESELRIAREIQKRMVPHVFPKRRDVDIYAMMTPAKEVGGDLYGYVIDDDLLYFCVGDVSGKGVPAALFMAEVTRMFRTLVDGRLKPEDIASRLNRALVEDNDQGMFVTMFIGLIHIKSGRMEFCNAGHNPPLLNGEYIEMESNAPIGLWSEVEYEGEVVADMHGKTLFVYTDGINEAHNSRQEQFGDERLKALLQTDRGSARQTSEYVHNAVKDFVGDAEASDDVTKMCIKLK